MKKQGVLIYDDVIGRMDIRFGPLDYYGGLHCGERLEAVSYTHLRAHETLTAENGWRCCLTESGSRRESNSVSSGISKA